VRAAAACCLLALTLAGCGGSAHRSSSEPGGADAFATRVVRLVVESRYAEAWGDLHPADRAVAPEHVYVACEERSAIALAPTRIRAVGSSSDSVALGDGRFVPSRVVRVRIDFPGGFHFVHPVHLVASGGRWTWILPAERYRAYRAGSCRGAPATTVTTQA
jgi:hypothetical protein